MIDLNEINVVDDNIDEMDIIKDTINTKEQEDAFYIADIGGIIKKHLEWMDKMPKVIPHYAIKCNSEPTVIKLLAAMNASFDCASMQEIRQVMQHDVKGDRIIFAHPTKLPTHIKYSKKVGVERMTVDSETELSKIQEFFPEAKVVIRIRCDAKNSISLGTKFGCDPREEAVRLIQCTKDLGLNLHGFSFHVGTPCRELEAYRRGIEMCAGLIDVAKAIGCRDVRLIDIGGGFTADCETEMDRLAEIINDATGELDPAIRVISEPGRYYVSANFTLASYLHSKRTVFEDNGKSKRMYYMNCGVFNGFFDELLGLQRRTPRLLFEPMSNETFSSILWGPTADSYDLIVKDVSLPELYVGDWLVWENMGAYTLSLSNAFNGFPIPAVIPFVRRSQWESFLKHINPK